MRFPQYFLQTGVLFGELLQAVAQRSRIRDIDPRPLEQAGKASMLTYGELGPAPVLLQLLNESINALFEHAEFPLDRGGITRSGFWH